MPDRDLAGIIRTGYRRLRRRLDGLGGAFELDFTSRVSAVAIFEEGTGSLLTDGSRACMTPSHLAYGVAIEGGETGEMGLRITMDDQDVTCGHDAMIATGHLASRALYSFGDFEWRGRVHHAPGGGAPPSNAFTCFSTFIHGTTTHNELAWCFPAKDGREVHMSYWYDDDMHQTAKRLAVDLTKGVHTFTTRWREVGMDWLIDGVLVHKVRGIAATTIPWEPMSIKAILRPKNLPSFYLGDAYLDISRISYVPAYAVETAAQAPAPVQAPALAQPRAQAPEQPRAQAPPATRC